MFKNPKTAFAENPPSTEIILAFETGVGGGGISLFRRGEELGCWVGSGAVSRSEDILDETNKILLRSDIDKKNIGRVVFSRGPGSYTGLRIGASIAKGLSKSLDCELSACAVLEALTVDETENVIVAVPFGGRRVCWRFFGEVSEDEFSGGTETYISELQLFGEYLRRMSFKSNYKKLILHGYLYGKFAETDLPGFSTDKDESVSVINVGCNLARYIAEKSYRDGQFDDSDSTRLIYPTEFGNRDY